MAVGYHCETPFVDFEQDSKPLQTNTGSTLNFMEKNPTVDVMSPFNCD